MTEKLSTTALRLQNRNNVYRSFYQAGRSLTKQEIANLLSLSLPTVTQNLRDLLAAGLIAYDGLVESTGGRRARAIRVITDARFALGVALSVRHVQIVAVDLMGQELGYRRIALPFDNGAEYRAAVGRLVETFLDETSLDRKRLLGVGVTIPGIINQAAQMIEVAPVLGLRRMDLSVLTGLFPCPVRVVNDASAGGYAEWWNRRDLDSIAYLFLGKGVGGALLLGGQPYMGAHGRSGEFGHMTIAPGGKVCKCGQQGCLEAYCSVARLTDDFGGSLDDFFAALDADSERHFAVWQDYLDHLAAGINSIRMALDCDVVLGGVLAPYLERYLPDLTARLGRCNSFEDAGDYVHLGKCQDKANCIGAALYYVDRFLREL